MRRHLHPALHCGLLAVICSTLGAAESAAPSPEVTDKTTDKMTAPAPGSNDYRTLCRMAESNGDSVSAWAFAEKWADSREPAERRAGIVKLLELALNRDPETLQRVMIRAEENGIPPDQLELWKVRRALRHRQYAEALKTVEGVVSQGGLRQEDLCTALQLQTRALIGLRRYQEAAETALKRRNIEPDRAAQFDARCQQIYALAMARKTAEVRKLLTETAAENPDFTGDLLELQMMLAAISKDWAEFRKLFEQRTQNTAVRKGGSWYFAACRLAAGHAENPEQAIRLRRAALQAAASDPERKTAMLELLKDLEKNSRWLNMAEMIRLYLEWYPNVPDRAELELRAARYLIKAARMKEGLSRYDELLKSENPGLSRFRVAMEAADQCAANNLFTEEQRYLEWALEHAGDQAEHQAGSLRLGHMYSRRDMHDKAQKAYRIAAEDKGPRSEEARFFCLQELIRLKSYGPAEKEAKLLCAAGDPKYRAAADYHLANLLELTGKPAEAAKAYLVFAEKYPESEFMPAALYNAALLTEKTGNDAAAAERLKIFAEKCPLHALAPNALLKLMLHQERLGQWEEAKKTAERLERDFPRSPFASAALFRLADRTALEKHYSAALEYLNRIEALKPDFPGIHARLLFDRAAIHARLENPRKALKLLEKLLATEAAAQPAADAAQLAGYLHAQLGEYAAAANNYARAAQLRPGGAFAEKCMEKKADVLYAEGTFSGRPDLIRMSLQEYRILLGKTRSQVRLLYKSGLCHEALGKKNEALKVYSELLYRSAAARSLGIRPDPVWCPRALYAAIRIDQARRSLDGARHALRLIALARSMGLTQDGEIQALEQELCRKYKL